LRIPAAQQTVPNRIAVKWSFNDSLKKLGLDYVDLYLIHWPIACESNADKMPKIGPDGKVPILALPAVGKTFQM